jgi:hypothetical protein
MSWDVFQGIRLGNDLRWEFATAGISFPGHYDVRIIVQSRVGGIQAVQKTNVVSISPEDAGDIEKPYWFYPEVIGGKIVYPWIDQKKASFHKFSFITTTCQLQ